MKNSKLNQLKRGFSKRCPQCGNSPIFLVILKHLIVVNRVELNSQIINLTMGQHIVLFFLLDIF